MACLSATGELAPSGRALLETLREPRTAEAAAALAGQPLFRVRAGLRELAGAGLIEAREDGYVLTEAGAARLEGA